MIKALLIVAETLLAIVMMLSTVALGKLRKYMAGEAGRTAAGSATAPWKAFRQYKLLHPESILNKCYIFLSISLWLLSLGMGVVGFCFGRLSGQ